MCKGESILISVSMIFYVELFRPCDFFVAFHFTSCMFVSILCDMQIRDNKQQRISKQLAYSHYVVGLDIFLCIYFF